MLSSAMLKSAIRMFVSFTMLPGKRPHRQLDEICHKSCKNDAAEAAQDCVVDLKPRCSPHSGTQCDKEDWGTESNYGHAP